MSKPFDPIRSSCGKLIYCIRNPEVVPATDIWPHRADLEGKNVLVGERWVNDGWQSMRTSLLVSIKGNDYETLNTIYRINV